MNLTYCIAAFAVAVFIACVCCLIFLDIMCFFIVRYWTRICSVGALVSFIIGGLLRIFGETDSALVWGGISLMLCGVFTLILVLRSNWRIQ